MSTTIPRDITLPAAPVEVRYTSNSANIAFYRIGDHEVGSYVTVLRSDDMTYLRDNRPKRPTRFHFALHVHNGKQRWREMRWVFEPRTLHVNAKGNLSLSTVKVQVNIFLREHQ